MNTIYIDYELIDGATRNKKECVSRFDLFLFCLFFTEAVRDQPEQKLNPIVSSVSEGETLWNMNSIITATRWRWNPVISIELFLLTVKK